MDWYLEGHGFDSCWGSFSIIYPLSESPIHLLSSTCVTQPLTIILNKYNKNLKKSLQSEVFEFAVIMQLSQMMQLWYKDYYKTAL